MKKFICMIIALTVAISCVAGLCVFSGDTVVSVADNASDLANAKENLKKAKEQIAEIRKQLEEISGNRDQLMAKKNLLDQEINAIESQIETIRSDLVIIEAELEEKGAELAVVQNRYDENLKKFRSRARASYENGTQTYLEALLSSTDLSELLTKMDLVEEVSEYDSKLLNDLSSQAAEIKVLYDQIVEREEMKKDEIEAQATAEAALISRRQDIQITISELNADKALLESQEDLWSEREAAAQKEIAKLAGDGVYYGEEFCWPVPGHSSISSPFGYRTYTYNGRRISGFHHAIDIPAPSGSKVVAAGDGKILKAGWVTTGGGRQVVVDHGSKLLTYYNHLSGFACSAGQTVRRGQTIGYVGMSGTATGNHLDFAIMFRGEYLNPSYYVNPSNSKPAKSIKALVS